MKKTVKKLGIWMDHSMAHLMEFSNAPFEIETIESELTEPVVEQRRLIHYYNRLAESVKNYQQVVLFGPSDAKMEFFDVLSEDERFVKIKIEIFDTDKMTRNQQHHFIKEYFLKG